MKKVNVPFSYVDKSKIFLFKNLINNDKSIWNLQKFHVRNISREVVVVSAERIVLCRSSKRFPARTLAVILSVFPWLTPPLSSDSPRCGGTWMVRGRGAAAGRHLIYLSTRRLRRFEWSVPGRPHSTPLPAVQTHMHAFIASQAYSI